MLFAVCPFVRWIFMLKIDTCIYFTRTFLLLTRDGINQDLVSRIQRNIRMQNTLANDGDVSMNLEIVCQEDKELEIFQARYIWSAHLRFRAQMGGQRLPRAHASFAVERRKVHA
jgi:hypothetical protein